MKSIVKNQKSRVAIVLVLILAVVLIVQVERFITHGTFLGYQVRSTNKPSVLVEDPKQKSAVCRSVSNNTMSRLVQEEVRSTALFPDKKDIPTFSGCLYNSKRDKEQTVTVALRKLSSESEASQSLGSQTEGAEPFELEEYDEAYRRDSDQYFIRKGDQIVVISFSDAIGGDGQTRQGLAQKISAKLFK